MKTLISIAITMLVSLSAWAKPGSAISSTDFNAMIQESKSISGDLDQKLKDQVGSVNIKKEAFGKVDAENKVIETEVESIASPTNAKYLQKNVTEVSAPNSLERVSQEVKDANQY